MDPNGPAANYDIIFKFVVLVILLFLSAFFSSAETAFVTVNQIRMRSLADDGKKRASLVLKITSDKSKMLSAILIGNNLVNLYASALMTTITLELWGNAYVSAATGILTFVLLILGEIAPKNLATTYADRIAPAYCHVIWVLMIVLTPFIFVINKIAMGFLWIFGYRGDHKEVTVTEDELRTIVDVSHEEGVLEEEEHELLANVFDFGDAQVKDIMVPRVDMTCVSVDSTYAEILDAFRQDMYTRLPVYDESVDNVIGILNIKDLILLSSEDKKHFSVRDMMREAYYTYEFQEVSDLMTQLRKTSHNFAIVLDEYGSTVGMVTLEDILEELVGEIRDEYDEDEVDEITKLSEEEYLLAGTVRLDDLEEIFPLPERDPEHEDDFDSISGLIIHELERLPREGDEVLLPRLKLVVEECDKNRIVTVHAYILPEENEETSETDSEETGEPADRTADEESDAESGKAEPSEAKTASGDNI